MTDERTTTRGRGGRSGQWARGAGALAAAVVSGLLYPLAFPAAGAWWLAWVALAPFLVATRRVSMLAAAGLGWTWALVACAAIISWLPAAMARYYDQPLVVGVATFFVVSTLTAGLEFMLFAAVHRRLASGGWVRPFVVAAAWVAAELGRGKLFTGNPWALVAYSQVPVLPILQVADTTGVYGVSFVVVAVNAAIAGLWIDRRDPRARRAAMTGALAVAAVVCGVVAYGRWRLADGGPPAGGSVPVAVVQGDVEITMHWNPSRYGEHFEKYLRLTRAAMATARPAVVFWPENAMTFFVEREAQYRTVIASILGAADAQLVAGGPHVEPGPPKVFHNSAFLVASDGTILARQDKRVLIPFAEYFPMAGETLLRRRFGAVREFAHGAARPPLPTRAGRAGVLVCHEALYPEAAAEHVRLGAEYLVNLSNDSWHGGEKYALAAFDVVVLRAIEQRRWVVRASTAGPSGVVDAWGRAAVRTPPYVATSVGGAVVPRTDRTPYARWGDCFAWGCVAVTIATMTRGRRRERHEPRSGFQPSSG